MIGLESPLMARTLASLLMPTMRISPRAFASRKLRMWPTCSRSKQPLVQTTVFAFSRQAARKAANSSSVLTFEADESAIVEVKSNPVLAQHVNRRGDGAGADSGQRVDGSLSDSPAGT